jgi:hypothetical protein
MRIIWIAAVIVIVAGFAYSLGPDIARYVKIRSM